MRGNPGRHFVFAFIVICAVILADQYTKWLVMETMLRVKDTMPSFGDWFMTRKEIPFFESEREEFRTLALTPWLNLVMVWNQGISFGMFDTNSQFMPLVFIGTSLMISMVLIIWLALSSSGLQSFALALIIGGAIGNVCDRLRFSAVADFIDAHLGDKHWPAFNLADSAIVLGAFLLALHALFGGPAKSKIKTVDIE